MLGLEAIVGAKSYGNIQLYILILGFENVSKLNFVFRIQVCLKWINIGFKKKLSSSDATIQK